MLKTYQHANGEGEQLHEKPKYHFEYHVLVTGPGLPLICQTGGDDYLFSK